MVVWKLAFLTFFGTLASISQKLVVRISPNFYSWHITISALMCKEKSKIVLSEVGQKCEKPRNWGFGGVWGSPPYGAHTPDLTNPSYSPMGPEKNTFYSGGIGPHLGEILNFEIFNITLFEPILAKSLHKTRNDIKLQIRYTDRKCKGRPSAALGLDSVHAECSR